MYVFPNGAEKNVSVNIQSRLLRSRQVPTPCSLHLPSSFTPPSSLPALSSALHAFAPLLLSIWKQHFPPSLSAFPFRLQLEHQHTFDSINGTSTPLYSLHGVVPLLTAQQFPRHEGYTQSSPSNPHNAGSGFFLPTQSALDPTCSSQGQ